MNATRGRGPSREPLLRGAEEGESSLPGLAEKREVKVPLGVSVERGNWRGGGGGGEGGWEGPRQVGLAPGRAGASAASSLPVWAGAAWPALAARDVACLLGQVYSPPLVASS